VARVDTNFFSESEVQLYSLLIFIKERMACTSTVFLC
jgi:hypothetical protein